MLIGCKAIQQAPVIFRCVLKSPSQSTQTMLGALLSLRERMCPCCGRSDARGAADWGCFSPGWFWRRSGQAGGIQWKHCSAPAVNASLHRCRYYFWSPHSGQVAGKGLLHMKHHFLGHWNGSAKIENRLSPQGRTSSQLLPAHTNSQGTFCSLQLLHFRCSIQLENVLSSRCWQLWECRRRRGRKLKA